MMKRLPLYYQKVYRQKGMTLLELLVVLVLISMLATLLIQGVGFFLGKYEAVQRVQHRVTTNLVRREWFVNSVQGITPFQNEDKRFSGDLKVFRGVSMQALATESGRPVPISWVLDSEGGAPILKYHEGKKIEWEIHQFSGEGFAFNYADDELKWYENWPPRSATSKKYGEIPHAIKLLDAEGETMWFTRLPLFPESVIRFDIK